MRDDRSLHRVRVAAVTAVNRVATRAMPAIPDRARRVLAGRPVRIDGNTLDPTLRLALLTQRFSGEDGLTAAGDVATCRERVRQTLAILEGKPVPVAGVSRFSIDGPAGPIPVRHYRPDSDLPAPLLVYYHGGGFVLGDLDGWDRLCRLICSGAQIHVLSVGYRLAPEHPAPAALDDAHAAFRWAVEHAGELGADAGHVAVGGDSAGGNLATVVSRLARDAGPEAGAAPVLQLLIYPVTDMSTLTRSRRLFAHGLGLTLRDIDRFAHHYLGGSGGGSGLDPADPRVSPLLAADLSGLPPALVITAGFDPLRDEGEAYAAKLAAAGVAVDLRRMGSVAHNFVNLTALGGASAAAVGEMVSALRAQFCHP